MWLGRGIADNTLAIAVVKDFTLRCLLYGMLVLGPAAALVMYLVGLSHWLQPRASRHVTHVLKASGNYEVEYLNTEICERGRCGRVRHIAPQRARAVRADA